MKPAASGTGLATVLAERSLAHSSGIVRATRGKLRRVFCLVEGDLAFAASNVIEEQFDRFLVKRQVLTPEQRDRAAAEAARRGGKLVDVLRELPGPGDQRLRSEMEGFAEELLFSTLEWPDGAHEFEAGRPNLEGELGMRIPVIPLILKHARRFPRSVEAVRARIGPPNLGLRREPERAAALARMDCGPTVAEILARPDGTLAQLLAGLSGTEEDAVRATYVLVLLGALVPRRGSFAPLAGTRETPLSREECLAVLAREVGGDSYRVLGLTHQSQTDDVRAAYYSLARRYHPDRFRSGPLRDLLPRMESYFTKVTEAYNTLSSPELRAEYDRSLVAAPSAGEPKQGDPTHLARQNYLRGKVLAEKKHFADAATFLENAVSLDPMQAAYHLELGLLLSNHPRRRADAERALIRAAELEPTSIGAYLALGQMYQRAGHQAHAVRMYREVLRWDPAHVRALEALAGIGKAAAGASEVAFLEAVFPG